jgi:hypothetical protein
MDDSRSREVKYDRARVIVIDIQSNLDKTLPWGLSPGVASYGASTVVRSRVIELGIGL